MSSNATDSPLAQRHALKTSQVDEVGQFNDVDIEETADDDSNDLNVPTDTRKSKQTPPPTPPHPEKKTSMEIITNAAGSVRPVVVDPSEDDNNGDSNGDSNDTVEVRMGMMEIDQDMDEDIDADMERLLNDGSESASSSSSRPARHRCFRPYKIGSSTVICPLIHQRTGLGVVGVHWFGPLCTMGLLIGASHHFIQKAQNIGPITFWTCVTWSFFICLALIGVSFKDPGFVTEKPANVDLTQWRWCDFCRLYQPPDGAHCPDCNVCVAGYDHHCVWMGTCIGKENFKAFTMFNVSWLLYLIYAICWVSIIGPVFVHKHHDDE